MTRSMKIAIWLIAIGLWISILKPIFFIKDVHADRTIDVNITAVGGSSVGYGGPISVSTD